MEEGEGAPALTEGSPGHGHILSLPPHVLSSVLSLLQAGALAALRCTCRELAAAAGAGELWARLHEEEFGPLSLEEGGVGWEAEGAALGAEAGAGAGAGDEGGGVGALGADSDRGVRSRYLARRAAEACWQEGRWTHRRLVHDDWVYAMSTRPGPGRYPLLVTVGYDERMRTWDLDLGEVTKVSSTPELEDIMPEMVQRCQPGLRPLDWQERLQITAGVLQGDGTEVGVFDSEGSIVQVLQGHVRPVKVVELGRNGDVVAAGANNGDLIVWRLEGGTKILEAHHMAGVRCMQVGEGEIIVGYGDGAASHFAAHPTDAARQGPLGRLRMPWAGHGSRDDTAGELQQGFNACLCLSADFKAGRAVIGYRNSCVAVWCLRSHSPLHLLEDHTAPVLCVAQGPTLLATGGRDRQVHVYLMGRGGGRASPLPEGSEGGGVGCGCLMCAARGAARGVGLGEREVRECLLKLGERGKKRD